MTSIKDVLVKIHQRCNWVDQKVWFLCYGKIQVGFLANLILSYLPQDTEGQVILLVDGSVSVMKLATR